MSKYQVIVEFQALYPDAQKPEYQTEGAAGMDLHAYVPRANGRAPEALRIPSLGRLLVGTGIALAIPPGYEGQIRPRSGFALSDGISVLNSPGTIDSDLLIVSSLLSKVCAATRPTATMTLRLGSERSCAHRCGLHAAMSEPSFRCLRSTNRALRAKISS